MAHHTKEKGDLGALKAAAHLRELGYTICVPLSEHTPFDLVIYKDRTFLRTQVKFVALKDGALTVDLRSCWADKNGVHSSLSKAEIDLVAVYCPDNDTVYYLDPSTMKGQASLRVLPSKNKQSRHIRNADEHKTPVVLADRSKV